MVSRGGNQGEPDARVDEGHTIEVFASETVADAFKERGLTCTVGTFLVTLAVESASGALILADGPAPSEIRVRTPATKPLASTQGVSAQAVDGRVETSKKAG